MINVNGRELDYDEAIQVIKKEKAKSQLAQQKADTEKIIRENLVVVSVKECSGKESLVVCLADKERKYDFAMASVEKLFGKRYHLDARNAYKRYTVKTIEKPDEDVKELARKLCWEEGFSAGQEISPLVTKGVPTYVFKYINTTAAMKGLTWDESKQRQGCYPGVEFVEAFLREMFGIEA